MNQYGNTQNVPSYTGQQDSELVNNPRYRGQSGEPGPQGTTGPQQESRYGAAPVNTGTGQLPGTGHLHGTGAQQQQGGYGSQPTSGFGSQQTGGQGSYPQGMQQTQQTGGYGTQQTGGYGSQPTGGYLGGQGPQQTGGQGTYPQGPQQTGGYGSQQTGGQGTYPQGPQQTGGYGSQQMGTGIHPSGGYGTQDTTSQPTTAYGSQPGMEGPGSQTGYGSQATGGYGSQTTGDQFAKEQPGYGQAGFGAPTQGQNTGSLWPQPASPANAHKHHALRDGVELAGAGTAAGYAVHQAEGHHHHGHHGQNQGQGLGQGGYEQGGYGQTPYGQQPMKEGMVDKMEDKVGMGPRSHTGQDYGSGLGGHGQHGDQLGASPANAHKHHTLRDGAELAGAGTAAGYAVRQAEGHHHHGQNQGQGVGQGGYEQGGYGQTPYGQQPMKEGMVDKMEDKVGMGPRSHTGQDYGSGLGGHHQHGQHGDQLGDGYNTGVATGADAYMQQPKKEGVVDKVKDKVGMGPNSGYDSRTQTGNDAYVHGNHPIGQQDRVQGVNEPSFLGGEQGVGHHGLAPEGMQGETRTEPGYDSSKGNLTGTGKKHETLGEKLGGHHTTAGGYGDDTTGSKFGTTTGTDTYDDTTTGTGLGSGTGTGAGHGIGSTTGTGTGTGLGSSYDDTTTASPKKGLISKIKDKLHH